MKDLERAHTIIRDYEIRHRAEMMVIYSSTLSSYQKSLASAEKAGDKKKIANNRGNIREIESILENL